MPTGKKLIEDIVQLEKFFFANWKIEKLGFSVCTKEWYVVSKKCSRPKRKKKVLGQNLVHVWTRKLIEKFKW